MGISRSEAIADIERQRRSIREHIDKYHRYTESYDKDFAYKTIRNCQNIIANIKARCDSSIPDSMEDYWTP